MEVKLIISDVDKTLVHDAKKGFSDDLIKALKVLKQKEITFVLCSGRPTFSLINLARVINQKHDFIIPFVSGYNGAEIYSLEKEKYIYQNQIKQEHVAQINQFLLAHNVDIINYGQNQIYSNNPDNQYGQYEDEVCQMRILPLTKTSASPKVLGLVNPCDNQKVINLLKTAFPDFHISKSLDFFIEVTNKDINKSKTLEFLSDYLNIKPHHIMAFGDNLNDLEMIQKARYGICVANAIDELKSHANFILGDVKDDSVSKYLLATFGE